MRDPETERLLRNIRRAVAAARAAGVTPRACVWDATVAAVDGTYSAPPTPLARRTANAAVHAAQPGIVLTGM